MKTPMPIKTPILLETYKITEFFDSILLLENTDEVRKFFHDLMTESEIEKCAQRWQIARMLVKGSSYSKIEKSTLASSATILRISKIIHERTGGYSLIIDRWNKLKRFESFYIFEV